MPIKKDITEGSRGSTRIRTHGNKNAKYKKIRQSLPHVYPASQDMEYAPQGGFAIQGSYIHSYTWRN